MPENTPLGHHGEQRENTKPTPERVQTPEKKKTHDPHSLLNIAIAKGAPVRVQTHNGTQATRTDEHGYAARPTRNCSKGIDILLFEQK